MAEFQEVMKQAKRMCEAVRGCDNCPLDNKRDGCPLAMFASKISLESLGDAERIVMDWAAKHPEPRYPSWNEAWKQLFPDSGNRVSPCLQYFLSDSRVAELCAKMECCNECRNTPIPADIAEKLGIKPIGGGPMKTPEEEA